MTRNQNVLAIDVKANPEICSLPLMRSDESNLVPPRTELVCNSHSYHRLRPFFVLIPYAVLVKVGGRVWLTRTRQVGHNARLLPSAFSHA